MDTSAAPTSRLPTLADPEAHPAVAALFSEMRAGGARILNVHRTLAHAPHVLTGWTSLSRSLRHASTLDRRLCELAIMRQSQLMQSDYEWHIHRQMCRLIGIPDAQIDALADWRNANVYSDTERLVLHYTEEIVAGHAIDDALHAELGRHFSHAQIVELTATVSYFIGTTFLLRALDVRIGAEEGLLNPG